MNTLRRLPSVDKILQNPIAQDWIGTYGRASTVAAIRSSLEKIRQEYRSSGTCFSTDEIMQMVAIKLGSQYKPSLEQVINATGVVLHTNLGRAPISRESLDAVREIASGYSNLEFDLENGKRGSRSSHSEALLTEYCNAEAALVVNNNAAAVLLILTALAKRRCAVIARSQLVEIGGGFRIPDVMSQSGARLIEVGTTNRVHLSDYEQALAHNPALFLRAHRSNFQIIGFTSEPELRDIVQVAHQAGIVMVDDLGSGALLDTTEYGLAHEPMVQESLQAGCDLVCFSGDKLLGGPQAGIILGKKVLVDKLIKHPLARAVRADKFTLAALSSTLLHYVKGRAVSDIPIWKMISSTREELYNRVKTWLDELHDAGITCIAIEGESTIGGGSLPGGNLPTTLLALPVEKPDAFAKRLRQNSPPVIARIQDELVVFDPRTVLAAQERDLLDAIQSAHWRLMDNSQTEMNYQSPRKFIKGKREL